ncbi:MAG: threonine synthase [Candidatus Bathyarchaeia archaeon]
MSYYYECIECGLKVEGGETIYKCHRCGDLLEIKYFYDEVEVGGKVWGRRPISVWRYRELLPISMDARVVSLQEGGTRIHRCERLGEKFGLRRILVKHEGDNPTGSFKDRGMTVAITRAVQEGVKLVVCASTGNTSASMAAYAAKAGLKPLVIVPSGKIAAGKLAQAAVHGACVIEVEGNFDDALRLVSGLTDTRRDVKLLNSINPFRIEGQKTLSMEIMEQLKLKPNLIVLPVGNAGNITAVWKGLKEFNSLGLIGETPRLIGVQAEGAAPIAHAYRTGKLNIEPVPNPETMATAIRIGNPANWKRALRAVRDSKGAMVTVTDEEIVKAQKMLARAEGLFAEPASAATVAALPKLLETGLADKSEVALCVATGHGLKDPEAAISTMTPPLKIKPNIVELEAALKQIKGQTDV